MELQGKVFVFLGDSITEGMGTSGPEFRYDSILMREGGLKAAYNYGVGGTRIAHQRQASECARYDLSFCGRAHDLNPGADAIVVFGGVNDYGHGDAPFGSMEDRDASTFCGAVDYLMRTLLELYPKARIVFMTPARCQGDTAPSTHPSKQPDARPLRDYAQVILEKGKQYGIAVLDANRALGIDPNVEADCIRYTSDGLHLNDAGHEKLAAVLLDFLRQI